MDRCLTQNNVLLFSMPFAGIHIPSIQLAVLESYLKQRDINVSSRNLYLKAAEIFGINHYNFLIYPPNDSYIAQMFFSKYLFPDHWKKNYERLTQYFNERMLTDMMEEQHCSFDFFSTKTDNFLDWLMTSVNWKDYELIGFTLNYGQFLPSLAVAKMIKEIDPEKTIVLGGSRTVGELGINVLKTFDFIDYIVSGEGEEPLYQLASNSFDYKSIDGLIYRKDSEIKYNPPRLQMDLDSLPFPTFGSFFDECKSISQDILQYYMYYGCLPIEISRGCWWNKCSFCNLNIQFQRYREKSSDRIIKEIDHLSNTYKILNFQIIGNTLPIKNRKEFLQKLKREHKDYNFIAEIRADQYCSEEYTLLKDAGFRILQTGIESFSQSYLEKMCKGTKVIDNIASLKFCKENNIKNPYNLIINYPNEEETDFNETKNNIGKIKQFIDPPTICNLKVMYGSPIFCNQEMYNIKSVKSSSIDQIMFPPHILNNGFSFVYDCDLKNEKHSFDWKSLVNSWKQEHNVLKTIGQQTNRDIDMFIFFFIDGEAFIKIYDKRSSHNIQIYILNEIEREIFLSCIDIISFDQLQKEHSTIKQDKLIEILQNFIEIGIVFQQDQHYLSLPLDLRKCVGISKNDTERQFKEEKIQYLN